MANPIKWFRKNRKPAFAVLTIFVMFAFILIPIFLDRMQSRGGGRPNDVVVTTTKYGKLREVDIENLSGERGLVQGFLEGIRQQLGASRSQGRAVEQMLANMGANPTGERAVVDTWLLAQRAEELGLRVSDDVINDFLKEIGEGKISGAYVAKFLSNTRSSESRLFQALGREILALRLRGMFVNSIKSISPEQRYEYFLQFNRRAKIEAIPVSVKAFTDKVAEPSESQLKEFFETHKTTVYNPDSPEPGFRVPHQVNVQYLKADLQDFTDLKAVSEDAIRDYYEKNKDQYREPDLPEKAPINLTPEKPATPPAKPEAPKPEAPKPEAKSATQPEAKPEPPKPAPAKIEAPKASPKPEPAKPEAKKEPAKTSDAPRKSLIRMVAYEDKGPTAPPSKNDPPAIKPEKPVEKAAPPKVEKPEAKPVAAKVEPPAPKPEQPEAKPEAPKTDASASKEAPKKEPKYLPLEKVRDEIRRKLATDQASEKMNAVLTRLQDRLARYQSQRLSYDALDAKKKETETPPSPPDFAALAKEFNLKQGQTGLVTPFQMRDKEIGQTAVQQTGFLAYVYGTLAEYQPAISEDLLGNKYLFWKVKDEPEAVPDWSTVDRQLVLESWKMVEARDVAKKEAERLAADASQSKKDLKTLAASQKDPKVITPEPFTWLSTGDFSFLRSGSPPPLGEVQGIELAGMDFMRAVFRLKPGETGVAWNYPKTTVYVVRLVQYTPTENELWTQFIRAPEGMFLLAAQWDSSSLWQAWNKDLETQAGLKWVREPGKERRGRG